MVERRLGQLDLNTGEILENGFVAYVAPKRINGFGTRWFAMAQDPLEILAQSDLHGNDFRVLFKLMGYLDFENLIVVNQAEIARKLNMQPTHVRRSIKRLIDLDALLEGPRIGVNRSFRLNPRFGWKGSAKKHVVALDQERQRRMDAAGITGVIKGGQDQ
jgi:hypothetical protein